MDQSLIAARIIKRINPRRPNQEDLLMLDSLRRNGVKLAADWFTANKIKVPATGDSGPRPPHSAAVTDALVNGEMYPETSTPFDKPTTDQYLHNCTKYRCDGGHNFEHDNTGNAHNHSACEDMMNESKVSEGDWQKGYDY